MPIPGEHIVYGGGRRRRPPGPDGLADTGADAGDGGGTDAETPLLFLLDDAFSDSEKEVLVVLDGIETGDGWGLLDGHRGKLAPPALDGLKTGVRALRKSV